MSDVLLHSPLLTGVQTALTFKDATEHVSVVFDVSSTPAGRATMLVRAAVLEAYRDLPSLGEWKYYERRGAVVTSAAQSTGTVSFDFTGGTYERQLTLTGAVWPQDVRFWEVRVGGAAYPIDERKSDTVVTLPASHCPQSDFTDQTYILFRSQYLLPIGCRRISQAVRLQDWYTLGYAAPQDWMNRVMLWQEPGTPMLYTIRNTGDVYGSLVMDLAPPPSSEQTIEFIYQASPRPLRLYGGQEEYTTGTVTVSGTTVTGTGTSWTQSMVGAILRLSSTSAPPTGAMGTNPYVEQRVVMSVSGATSLTLDSTPSGTFSGVGYSIGDPIDIDPTVMQTAFLRLAESRYAQKARHKDMQNLERLALEAVRSARAEDNRHRETVMDVQLNPMVVWNPYWGTR